MNRTDVLREVEGAFGYAPDWLKDIPESVVGDLWQVMKKVQLGTTEIPNKYKELIGLAVAATTRCRYCTYFHTEAAKANGATDAEIKEAILMGSATNLFSTWLNGSQYDFEKFQRETSQMLEGARKQMHAGVR
ncbi:MAG: carboxymuconolactone decarboxylase family protein [Dehalococcoidales bacterium]|nr:carboxymuconolactone decarboxylase family protein [Dehalococcoidales bacterium]